MRRASSLAGQGGALGATLAGLVACGPSDSPLKSNSSKVEHTTAATASIGSASATTPSARPSAHSAKLDASDSWLLIYGGGGELAIIELRVGRAPVVRVLQASEESKALEKTVAGLAASDGIGLDMHAPGPGGKGRGALETTLMKPGDRLYPMAMRMALERAQYSVQEVRALEDPTPPGRISQLHISRDGERVGSIDFSKTPPVVTIHTQKSEGSGLTNDWADLQKLAEVKVRFHAPKAGIETLYEVEAKPGADDYPNAVRLHLSVSRQYDAQRTYKLEVVP